MDPTYHVAACSRKIARALSDILEAAQDASEGRALKIATQLENLAEELIYLRRQLLELPPQSSSALADSAQEDPFGFGRLDPSGP
jgi:hypothetical protein